MHGSACTRRHAGFRAPRPACPCSLTRQACWKRLNFPWETRPVTVTVLSTYRHPAAATRRPKGKNPARNPPQALVNRSKARRLCRVPPRGMDCEPPRRNTPTATVNLMRHRRSGSAAIRLTYSWHSTRLTPPKSRPEQSRTGYASGPDPPPFRLRFLSWRRAVFRPGR